MTLGRHNMSPYRTYLDQSIGLCGWCLYHKLDWQKEPGSLEPYNPGPGRTWPLACGLDDAPTQSYGTCSAWKNILDSPPLRQLQFSAHEWAELLRLKVETFRWETPKENPDDRIPP